MEINIKTKYNVNQLVYVLYDNKIIIGKIVSIQIISTTREKHNDIDIKYYLVNNNDITHRLGYYIENSMFDNEKQLLETLGNL